MEYKMKLMLVAFITLCLTLFYMLQLHYRHVENIESIRHHVCVEPKVKK